jgi:polysaccharide export outer membrane protein
MGFMRTTLAGLLAALAMTGCATRPSTFAELGPEANTRGFGEMYPPDSGGEFTFGIGDTVGLLVQNNPDLSGPFLIRMDGKITLNVIGDVLVAGLTPEQVRQKLEAKVAVYMRSPVITVTPTAIVSKRFYVAAMNPMRGGYIVRQVPYRGDMTLFEVWTRYMGTPSTSLDDDQHVKVIRPDPRHPVVRVINIREMLECGYSGGNIQIKPNDIVYVPPTVWGRVAQATAAIAAPFQGLFYLTNVYAQLDYLAAIVSGDADLAYGGFYGFGGYGGYGAGGLGGLSQLP